MSAAGAPRVPFPSPPTGSLPFGNARAAREIRG